MEYEVKLLNSTITYHTKKLKHTKNYVYKEFGPGDVQLIITDKYRKTWSLEHNKIPVGVVRKVK